MYNVLTIGGATQDLFIQCPSLDYTAISHTHSITTYLMLEADAKIEVDKLISFSGGGSTNTAVSFRRLGCSVATYCAIGNDQAGTIVLNDLINNGINTKLIHTSSHESTGISFIIDTDQGQRSILAYRGANSHLSLDYLSAEAIAGHQQLYITSLSNESAALLPTIASIAHQYRIPLALNPGKSQLSQGLPGIRQALPHVNTLILNSLEAKTLMMALAGSDNSYKEKLHESTGKPLGTLNDESIDPYLLHVGIACEKVCFNLQLFFRTVLSMGPTIVVVTNGKNGVYVATQKTIYFHPSIKTTVINTVGAGDAFGSCFVGSLLMGDTIKDAMRNGIINSASVLSYKGAKDGLLTMQELQTRRKALPEHLLVSFPL